MSHLNGSQQQLNNDPHCKLSFQSLQPGSSAANVRSGSVDLGIDKRQANAAHAHDLKNSLHELQEKIHAQVNTTSGAIELKMAYHWKTTNGVK